MAGPSKRRRSFIGPSISRRAISARITIRAVGPAVDLVPQVLQRVYTVGRLDDDSEGLLLLTNDGDLANRLMHPRYGIEKTYHVQVAGVPTREEQKKLVDGVWLAEGHVKAKSVHRLKTQGRSPWLEIVLAEGKNREVRRHVGTTQS